MGHVFRRFPLLLHPLMYLKMNTEIKNKKWDVGDYVILNKDTKLLKTSGTRSYSSIIGSHYVCIRETSEWQRGILIKGLGKVRGENLWIINGKPYCKDLREGNLDNGS